MKTLVQIVTEKHELERAIIECGGELDPILEHIDQELSADLENKAEKYCHYLDHIKHTADFWKDKAEQYTLISRSLHKVSDRIKDRLKMGLSSLGIKSVESPDFKVTISEIKKKLIILNEDLIPAKYKMAVTTFVVDKELLRSDMENGIDVPGAVLEQGLMLRYTPNRGTK